MAFVENQLITFALLLLCCGKQTWRTSRPREEVRWGFAKVKEWSYYVVHHPTLEVRRPFHKSPLFSSLFHSFGHFCAAVQRILTLGDESLSVLQNSRHSSLPFLLFLICSVYLEKVEVMLLHLPVGIVEVSGVSHFYSGTLWLVGLIFYSSRGKTLACRLKRMSAVGAVPGWEIEVLFGSAFLCFSWAFCISDIINGS